MQFMSNRPRARRAGLTAVVAVSLALLGMACTPLPPGTGIGEKVEVFVVGDSWAALAGNPQLQAERALPNGLGFVEVGQNVLKGQLNAVTGPNGLGAFDVVDYHPWGISGSTSQAWLAGNPCAAVTAATSCGEIPANQRANIKAELLAQIAAVPAGRTPLIYLSLGANDLIVAGGAPANGGVNLDLNNTPATNTAIAAIQSNLNAFIGQLLAAKAGTKILIAGYHTLVTSGFPCQGQWDARFPASAPVSQALINTAFDTHIDGMYDAISAVRGPAVSFTPHWYAFSTPPNPTYAVDLLCLHLTDYNPFVAQVLYDYVN